MRCPAERAENAAHVRLDDGVVYLRVALKSRRCFTKPLPPRMHFVKGALVARAAHGSSSRQLEVHLGFLSQDIVNKTYERVSF